MAPPRPAPAAPGEALLTAPRSPVPKRAGRRSLICFKYVSHMIDPAHGDRHRRWPESQEAATPALPGPPRCSACSSHGPGASCRLPGHPPAAPSPYAPQSTRHERWVAHFTEVWAGAGRGTLQSSRANRRSRDPRPSDKSLSHFHQQEVDTSLQRPALLSSSLTPDPQAPLQGS